MKNENRTEDSAIQNLHSASAFMWSGIVWYHHHINKKQRHDSMLIKRIFGFKYVHSLFKYAELELEPTIIKIAKSKLRAFTNMHQNNHTKLIANWIGQINNRINFNNWDHVKIVVDPSFKIPLKQVDPYITKTTLLLLI